MVQQSTGSDGVVTEMVRSHLASAAEEMRRTLIRTAFNPVIYDVLDFGISIYDRNRDLVAEAPGIPAFIGANDYAIKKGVEYVGEENMEPGDIVIMNYPYWSSAHTSDMTLFAPVFDPTTRELAAYECIRAHWIDIGAKDPGYVLDSNSIHQEGIVFPGTKVYARGEPVPQILEILRFNSRAPETLLGDLNAQIAAVRTGERRLHRVFEKFGLEPVKRSFEQLFERGERQSMEALATLPHGTWSATDYLDDDGISDEMIEIKVAVTINDKEFKVDYTGSSPAVPGPVNMPFGGTYSTCKIAFKSLTTPMLPSNAGNYRPLSVVAPPGSLLHAVYPAATYTLWTGHVAFEVIFKALAAPLLDRISACSGGDLPGFQMNGINPRTGRFYALSNNEPIGYGASSEHDGSNALQTHTANIARNTPTEVLEMRTGMMIERLELLTDSGGAGRFRGGLGVRRDIRIVEDGEILSVMKKTKTRPWALAGGKEPEPCSMRMFVGTPREIKVGTYRAKVRKGDLCVLESAGGGGFGDPRERDPAMILEDVLDEYVSVDTARDEYGVVISAGRVDLDATKKLRAG
ncbi:MAG: hydantoinase B/oxoprolinase family protein [Thaumarchaeota archaeon]|nr:hydantoinase B/oxoprolinase family protein [Nitrososphaerota archaeon]